MASEKKGIGLAAQQSPARVSALNIAWYYTWSPHPLEGIPEQKFVPMIWGKLLNKQIEAVKALGHLPYLLAINEPDEEDQANMSVEEVLRIWPEISGLADQISSPAPANILGTWFSEFFPKAKRQNEKINFISIHLYGPPNVEEFLHKVDAVYEKFHLPVWITEFAVADWNAKGKPGANRYSEETVLSFMKAVLPELEKRSYIVRYAWFGAGARSYDHEPVRTSRLFEKDGSLTNLGRFYAGFQ